MQLLFFCRYAAPFGLEEPENAGALRTATDAAVKKINSFFQAGSGVCASLNISKAAELPTMHVGELVPDLVKDWKMSTAKGGARTALALAKALS
jgi:hypothetical protein